MDEEFKKNERLAKRVMDILLNDYSRREEYGFLYNEKENLDIIEWSIIDYESCGFSMGPYKYHLNIIKDQYEQKLNRLRNSN